MKTLKLLFIALILLSACSKEPTAEEVKAKQEAENLAYIQDDWEVTNVQVILPGGPLPNHTSCYWGNYDNSTDTTGITILLLAEMFEDLAFNSDTLISLDVSKPVLYNCVVVGFGADFAIMEIIDDNNCILYGNVEGLKVEMTRY